MNIKEITYSRSAKVNIGGYENRDFTVSVTVGVDKKKDADEHMDEIREWVKNQLASDIKALKER